MLTDKAYERIKEELRNFKPIPLSDLFKIRDALDVLDRYGLADKDLLQEVNKYIQEFI